MRRRARSRSATSIRTSTYTGRVTGFAVVDLDATMGGYDWRLSETNVWKVERMLLDYPHQQIGTSDARYKRLKAAYREYRAAHDGQEADLLQRT